MGNDPLEDLINKFTDGSFGNNPVIQLVPIARTSETTVHDAVEEQIHGLFSKSTLTKEEADFLLNLLRIHIDLTMQEQFNDPD